MFVPRYGLFGADANYDYNLIKLIDEFGWDIHMDVLASMANDSFIYRYSI